MARISCVSLVSKEGHGEAKEVSKDIALILLEKGFNVTSFPNIHVRGVDHVPTVKEIASTKSDLVITVSGDGTLLKVLRILDNTLPCLCVNVGGRGILAEIKPDQARMAVEKIERGDFRLERRVRISASWKNQTFPPALNEVFVLRQSVTRTPTFTLDLGGATTFVQRMDGVMVSTATGSTGHSFSYGSPFIQGSLEIIVVSPLGSITNFPPVIRDSSEMRVMASYALHAIVDGQDAFSVEPNSYVTFKRHERDAVFVRFEADGSYRQLRNLGFE